MRIVFSFLVSILLIPALHADDTSVPSPGAPLIRAADRLDYRTAAVLGVVEGVTEYLPVSSTGHLIIANQALHLNEAMPALGKEGQILYVRDKEPLPIRLWKKLRNEPVATPADVPFSLKNAADAYIIVIQFGAILAVLFAYWHRVAGLLGGLFTFKAESYRLTRNLLVAFLPAAAIGFVFNGLIEQLLFGILPVILALAAGAVTMLAIERWHRRQMAKRAGDGPDLHELTVKKSLGIGLAQCFALWPGTSRSMATICGGYLVGLSPARATEFSFLLGLVTLTAASAYKILSSGKNMLAAFDTGPLALGLLLATVTAFFSVKWLVGWISRHGLALFAFYRIGLAAVLFVLFYA